MSTALMFKDHPFFKYPEKPDSCVTLQNGDVEQRLPDPKWKQATIADLHETIRQFHCVVNAWRDNPQVGLEEVAGAAEGTGKILIAAAKQMREHP